MINTIMGRRFAYSFGVKKEIDFFYNKIRKQSTERTGSFCNKPYFYGH